MQSFILDRHTDPSNPTMKVTQDDKIPIYDSKADAEADISNIEEGGIVATKDTGATEKVVDVVQDGNMNPVTSNAVYDALLKKVVDVSDTNNQISVNYGFSKPSLVVFSFAGVQFSTFFPVRGIQYIGWDADYVGTITFGSSAIDCIITKWAGGTPSSSQTVTLKIFEFTVA